MGENVLSLQFSIKTEKTRRNERKKKDIPRTALDCGQKLSTRISGGGGQKSL